MGWFSNLQDNRRLTAENENLSGRVAFLEKERERLLQLVLERDTLMTDRIITLSGSYAVADEAKAKAGDRLAEVQRLRDLKTQEELAAHLDSVQARIRQDAKDAGLSDAEADAEFARNRDRYVQEFYNDSEPFL